MTKPNQYLIIVLLTVTACGAAIPANADEETLAAAILSDTGIKGGILDRICKFYTS